MLLSSTYRNGRIESEQAAAGFDPGRERGHHIPLEAKLFGSIRVVDGQIKGGRLSA